MHSHDMYKYTRPLQEPFQAFLRCLNRPFSMFEVNLRIKVAEAWHKSVWHMTTGQLTDSELHSDWSQRD